MAEVYSHPRTFSNKENFSSASSPSRFHAQPPVSSHSGSNTAKPTIKGIGRAPRARGGATGAAPQHRFHSINKVKQRLTSVERAKKRVIKKQSVKTKAQPGHQGGSTSEPITEESEMDLDVADDNTGSEGSRSRVRKSPSMPISDLLNPTATSTSKTRRARPGPIAIERISIAKGKQPASKTPTPPPVQPIEIELPNGQIQQAAKVQVAPVAVPGVFNGFESYLLPYRIHPYTFDKPSDLPNTKRLNENGDEVPIDFLVKRLANHLPQVYDLCQLFVPASRNFVGRADRVPVENPGARPIYVDDTHDQFPIFSSQSAWHDGFTNKALLKMEMSGPTDVIAFRQMGQPGSEPIMVVINRMVLASQCGRFEQRLAEGKAMRIPTAPHPEGEQPSRASYRSFRADKMAHIAKLEGVQLPTLASHPVSRVLGARSTPMARTISIPPAKAAQPPIAHMFWKPSNPTSTANHDSDSDSSDSEDTVVPDHEGKTLSSDLESPSSRRSSASSFTSNLSIDPAASPKPYFRTAEAKQPPINQEGLPCVDPQLAVRYGLRHVPLSTMYVPDLPTLKDLVYFLHHPNSNLVNYFLGFHLYEGKGFSEFDAVQEPTCPIDCKRQYYIGWLSNMPFDYLCQVLDHIRGFRSNVWYLGINSDSFWSALLESQWIVNMALERKKCLKNDKMKLYVIPKYQHAMLGQYPKVLMAKGMDVPAGYMPFHRAIVEGDLDCVQRNPPSMGMLQA